MLNMQVCPKLVSRKITLIVADCQHLPVFYAQALIDRVGMRFLESERT